MGLWGFSPLPSEKAEVSLAYKHLQHLPAHMPGGQLTAAPPRSPGTVIRHFAVTGKRKAKNTKLISIFCKSEVRWRRNCPNFGLREKGWGAGGNGKILEKQQTAYQRKGGPPPPAFAGPRAWGTGKRTGERGRSGVRVSMNLTFRNKSRVEDPPRFPMTFSRVGDHQPGQGGMRVHFCSRTCVTSCSLF